MENVYEQMTIAELDDAIALLEDETARIADEGLQLDMARGKPSAEQIALSLPLLDVINSNTNFELDNASIINYGIPWGLPKARELAAELLGVDSENVIVSGSSSLHLEHDLVLNGFAHGIAGCDPWCAQGGVKFLCPSPGYDRHFSITERYGIENIPIPLGPEGPDMDEVARYVENDASVKGIWCVPKYSNPSGCTYSAEVVKRFATLRPAAQDFRIFWDNAYVVHDIYEDAGDSLLNIFDALQEAGNDNLVYEFASTSKITFPGSGMSWLAASDDDINEIKAALGVEQVGPEKLSQLAHTLFFSSVEDVYAHMRRHAAIVRPRFELVERKLTEGLGALGIASWSHPSGGYFVSFDGPRGSARSIVSLMAELGVTMTGAGATWPYQHDPFDSNIRIAPTYPSLQDLGRALDVFVVVVRLVSARIARAEKTETLSK